MPNHNILWLGIFLLISCFLWYSPFLRFTFNLAQCRVFMRTAHYIFRPCFHIGYHFLSKSKKESNETPYKVESAFNANNEGSVLPNSYLA